MLLDCPTCSRGYHTDPSGLAADRMVVCPRCQTRWFTGNAFHQTTEASRRDDLLRLIGVGDHTSSVASERPAIRAPDHPRRFAVVSAFASLICIAVLLVGGRETVVRLAPRAASLYAAVGWHVRPQGLEFMQVASARRDAASSDVIIAGKIRNGDKRRLAVPRLVYDIRDAAGASLVKWTESPRVRVVAAGQVLAFASSPHHLPADSRTVLVRFEVDGDTGGTVEGR